MTRHRFPRLRDHVGFTPSPGGGYVVEGGGVSLKIGRLEHAILSNLDGRTPLGELERGVAMAMGVAFKPGTAARLVDRVAEVGLVDLPEAPPPTTLPDLVATCDASGRCCHLRVGPLDPIDAARLQNLPWDDVGEAPPKLPLVALDRAGNQRPPGEGDDLFLRRRPDGACVFLEQDGRCMIHRVFGYQAKPAICRLYPLFSVMVEGELRVGTYVHCPGSMSSGATRVEDQARELSELLLTTTLEAGPLRWWSGGPEVPKDLEAEALARLDAPGEGAAAEHGLAKVLDLALENAPPGASQGKPAQVVAKALYGYFAEEDRRDPAMGPRLLNLTRWLGRAGCWMRNQRLFQIPVTRDADRLSRRNLRTMLYTRRHLFGFGFIPGLVLMGILQAVGRLGAAALILRDPGEDAGLAPDQPPLTTLDLWRGLDTMYLAALGLDDVEDFPGVGTLALEELEAILGSFSGVVDETSVFHGP